MCKIKHVASPRAQESIIFLTFLKELNTAINLSSVHKFDGIVDDSFRNQP